MKKEQWYKLIYYITRPFIGVLFPQKNIGRDNIPEGPALICANHSSGLDALMLPYAMGKGIYLRIMAKHELKKIPVIGWILGKAGVIFVRRGERDIDSFKNSMRALKSGEKLALFPEGTRVRGDDSVAAKTGAVHMAARAGVPIVPVYIPREKKIFRPSRIVIGQPYYIKVEARGDFEGHAQELMNRIWALGEQNHE